MKVLVVGLGLVGGSLARDLAAAGHTVIGDDAADAHVAAALDAGVLSGRGGIHSDAADADVVLLATPVHATIELIREHAVLLRRVPLVMDVGSTKADIMAAAAAAGLGVNFIGAHPLAGDHRSGWQASRTGLFRDATVYLCPPAPTSPALAYATEFWRELGAHTTELAEDAHDTLLAWSSHLPQFTASALALALAGNGTPRMRLGPGGLDMTRLAGSEPGMWTGIATQNADALVTALDALSHQLDALRADIRERRSDELHARLNAARAWFAGDPAE